MTTQDGRKVGAHEVAQCTAQSRWRLLPPVGSIRYHVLLGAIASFVLGPLGGIAATYMNLSLGIFVSGQLLAGILGSAVTFGYGPEGRHGANYMQTLAASVASMSAMGVLVQAMVWLGMELPEAWQLMLFFGCVGMLGVGIGMLYTPLLVDRLALTFPSGLAVAHILRALSDKRLLERSIAQLGAGAASGALLGYLTERISLLSRAGMSAATLGAGLLVGSRIAVPGLVLAALGAWCSPALREAGFLGESDSFRKLGFLAGLSMILGAACVDLTIIGRTTLARLRALRSLAHAPETARPLDLRRLLWWTSFWAVATVLVGHLVLAQPLGFLCFGVGLSLIFVLINGICMGVSDQNPISSAFVIAVLLMSALGLRDPITGIIAASILLVACSTGVDMQQDRSTGARLGSDRVLQFRYQVAGVGMGAVLAVGLVHVFMTAYPVLAINTFEHPEQQVAQWQSAMTFKLVGAIGDLGHLPRHKLSVLAIGLAFGVATELARKGLQSSERYRRFTQREGAGFACGWLVDALLLSSPYAFSLGAFVELPVAIWFAAGGIVASLAQTLSRTSQSGNAEDALPRDMSLLSLLGGGLIAGEALWALIAGLLGLFTLMR